MSSGHDVPADQARSFGLVAKEYERGRPEWPEAVTDAAGLPAEATVLDLAAGTGKLTRLLVRRFARVLAVEPDPAMRAELVRLVPQAEALAGEAEAIPLGDDSVDAVFVAQAFHWFDVRPAIDEVARVLRPDGTLVLVWILPADGGLLPDGLVPEDMDTGVKRWREEFAGYFSGSQFGPFGGECIEHEQVVSREDAIAYFASVSWVSSMPDDRRADFFRRLERVLDQREYRRRWSVEVHWTRRCA
jgi:SAM-dependent methyltransferase